MLKPKDMKAHAGDHVTAVYASTCGNFALIGRLSGHIEKHNFQSS